MTLLGNESIFMTALDATTQLYSQAAVLLMVGMGFVFTFLALLILVIKYLISPLSLRFPDSVPQQKQDRQTDPAVIAAIGIAISKYRQKHQNNP